MRGVKAKEGDRIIRSDGYAIVFRPKWESSWKSGRNKGWIVEHKYEMEKFLGRFLADDEIVHHKNHNRSDNRIENLQLLNRSEHAKLHAVEDGKEHGQRLCLICGNELSICKGAARGTLYCRECYNEIRTHRHKQYPDVDELCQLCEKYGFVVVGKMFGVSDNAIRKRIKHYGRDLPTTKFQKKKHKLENEQLELF